MAKSKLSKRLIDIVEVLKRERELYISEIHSKLGLKKGYQALISMHVLLLALYGVIEYRKMGVPIVIRLSENYEENLNKLLKDLKEKTWVE